MENLGGWKPPLLGLRHLDVLLKVNRRSTSLTSMATIGWRLEFEVVRKRIANGKIGRLETAPPWAVPFRCIAKSESPKYEVVVIGHDRFWAEF